MSLLFQSNTGTDVLTIIDESLGLRDCFFLEMEITKANLMLHCKTQQETEGLESDNFSVLSESPSEIENIDPNRYDSYIYIL